MSKTTSIDIGTFTNVGIGDPTPSRALDVRASADSAIGLKDISLIGTNKGDAPMLSLQSYYHDSVADQRTFQLQVVDGNNTAIQRGMVLQPLGGNVGIGTTSPALTMPAGHAVGPMFGLKNNLSASISLFRDDTSIVNGNGIGGIFFYGNGSTNAGSAVSPVELASIECKADQGHSDDNHGSALYFHTNNGTTNTSRMVLDKNGNVGIGVAPFPAERLRIQETRPDHHLVARFQDEGNDDPTIATGDGVVKAVRINSRPSGYGRSEGIGYITYLDLAVDPENAVAGFGVGYGSSGLPAGQTDLSQCEIVLKPGKVGIGTTNPASKLSIHNTGSASVDAITLSWEHLTSTSGIEQRIKWKFGDDATGNAPSEAAYIAAGKANSWTTGANRNSYLSFATTDGGNTVQYGGTEPNYTAVERMRIGHDGNVGIGTSSPISPLTVEGANDTTFDNISNVNFTGTDDYNSNAGAGIIFGGRYNSNNDITTFGQISSIKENNTDGDYKAALTFGTRDGSTTEMEKMRITSAGNVGIGTKIPDANLHVRATHGLGLGVTRDITTSDTGFGARIKAESRVGTSTATDRQASIATYRITTGNAYTGVLLQSRESGTINYLYHDNAGVLRTTTDGTHVGTTNGSTVGAQTSDERFKNIEDGFEYGLSHVLQLQPIAYTQENDAFRKLGFGAQTTQKIVPESVFDTGDCIDGYDVDSEDEANQIPRSDDTRLGMEYVQLIPVLTKAIQEQQTIIEDLKSRIETLEQ